MTILETETIPLSKIRQFLAVFGGNAETDLGSFRVDDTDGKITITLSVGNDHSCLALNSKGTAHHYGACPL